MKSALSRLALCLTALTLAGCGGSNGSGVNSASKPVTVQKIGNAQEFGDVVSLLDQGDGKAARKKLNMMVKRDPNDVRSKALLMSLDADPVGALGAKAFDYRVEPGDTMQAIAQHFLGDRLKFYILARYNGMAAPASLKVGQIIRVPGDAPPPKPAPVRNRSEVLAPPPSSPMPRVGPRQAPPKLALPAAPAINAKRAAQLRTAGLGALNKGQIGQAVGLLSQALSVDPGNMLIQRDLGRARRIQATVNAKR
jgi:hypothetical protein